MLWDLDLHLSLDEGTKRPKIGRMASGSNLWDTVATWYRAKDFAGVLIN